MPRQKGNQTLEKCHPRGETKKEEKGTEKNGGEEEHRNAET